MQNSIRIYYIILFLATIVGCFGFRKHTKPFKLLTIDLITTSATEAIAYYLDETLKISNTPPYHLFQIIEFMLVAAIYKNQIVNKHLKKILTYSIVIYPIIMIGFAFFLQPLKIYPSYSSVSYTHLDVYKRQIFTISSFDILLLVLLNFNKFCPFTVETITKSPNKIDL